MIELDFYDVVTIGDTDATRRFDLQHKEGVILGRAEEEGRMHYAVMVGDETYALSGDDIAAATGRKVKREDIYSGESIRVSPEGELLDGPNSPPLSGNGSCSGGRMPIAPTDI